MIAYENFDLRIRADGDGFVVSARHGSRVANEPLQIDLSNSWELEDLEKLGRDGVRQRGATLFEAVMHGDIRDLYHQARGGNGPDPKVGLRIRIQFDPHDQRLRPLMRLPWEIVVDRSRDGGTLLALDPRRPIVRVIDSIEQTVDPGDGRVERVLLALANPAQSQPLQLEREVDQVTAALSEAGVKPMVLRKTTRARLLETIADVAPQIVHYIGHGVFDEKEGQGALLLEDDDADEDRFFASAFAACFVGKPMPRLVILSACLTAYSGTGAASRPLAAMAVALTAAGLPAVIAMQSEVLDRNAAHFTGRLYRCIARGGAIEAAVAEARATVTADRLGKLDWAAPVLFVRAHVPALLPRPDLPSPPPGWRRILEDSVQEGRYSEAVRFAETLPADGLSAGDLEFLKQQLLRMFDSLYRVPTSGFVESIQWSREIAGTLHLQASHEAASNARKATSIYDEIYSRFQNVADDVVQEHVRRALVEWIYVGWHRLRDPAVDAVADVVLARSARSLASPQDAAHALLVKAEIRFDALQFTEAARLFDEVLAGEISGRQLTRARIWRAKALAGLGRTLPALVQLNDVISAFDAPERDDAPNVYEAYTLQATLLEDLGHREEALRSLERGCRLLVGSSGEASVPVLDVRIARGRLAERLGWRDVAVSEYAVVVEYAGRSAALAGCASRARRALQRLRNGNGFDSGGNSHGQ